MRVNILWNFREACKNARALKQEYLDVLALFSYKDVKLRKEYIGRVRKQIYSIQLEEWEKDKIWEYMNDDLEYIILVGLANRQKLF